jgi:RimJ/RimL family protein N-acetyltransferase
VRRFEVGDLAWFARLQTDPEVMEFLGGTKTREKSEEILYARAIDYYDAYPGLGMWMTIERATGRSIGFHLLNNIQGETIIQVGYGLERSAWGKGYATEMAREIVRYGFEDRGLPRIAGITSLPNIGSQRVLEKSGLVRNGERAFSHPAYASQGPLAWFEIERDAWTGRRR